MAADKSYIFRANCLPFSFSNIPIMELSERINHTLDFNFSFLMFYRLIECFKYLWSSFLDSSYPTVYKNCADNTGERLNVEKEKGSDQQ